MKRKYIIPIVSIMICCIAVARTSLGRAVPISSALLKAALLMTTDLTQKEEALPAPQPEETEEETIPQKTEEKVVFERTITTAPLSEQGLYISNLADAEVDISELLSLPDENKGGTVLILHTHGCEAYTPTEKYNYTPTSDFRTTDAEYNVVRVGNEIEKALTDCGIKVIHDTTLCDYPSYNDSYNNSLALANKYVSENPDIKVILDIHRDSIAGSNGEQIKTVGAENTSQLMFVVGTDMAGLEHPLWRQNLSFALKLQKQIISKYPDIMRPINLRTHRFNQQVSTGSLIVEVGSDGNTLEEALNAAKIFGQELGEYLNGV